MSIARRSFLKSATMTTLSAGLAISSAHLILGQQSTGQSRLSTRQDSGSDFQIPIEAEANALFTFRPSTFRPYVGDIFQIPNSRGEMIELKLTRVNEYRMKAATRITTKRPRQSQAFSLTFNASEPLPPFTSIQKISHPALGDFDLFLTSHMTDDGIYVYEAVFNHLQ